MTNSKKKILLIDDDPSVSSAILMLLKDEFDTYSAGTVREGIRLYDSLSPNVVILDLHLPDNHGLEALRAIRNANGTAAVIILTGFATLEVVEESMRLGASDCLHKPFDAFALRSRLRELSDHEEREPEVTAVEESPRGYRVTETTPEDLASSAFLHDISNPLTSLLAFSTLLRDDSSDPKRRELLSRMIHENLEYLSSLVDQWRAFSAPDSLPPDFAGLSVIAERAMQLVQPRAEVKNVAITLSVQNHAVRPALNRHAVVRILANLLQNAVEAVDRDEGKVALLAREKGGFAEFVINDNGCGIEPSATQKIFQPRYTTKRKGSGLGLYIARNIVESADGAISIFSRPGRGTSFTVQLPIC